MEYVIIIILLVFAVIFAILAWFQWKRVQSIQKEKIALETDLERLRAVIDAKGKDDQDLIDSVGNMLDNIDLSGRGSGEGRG